MVSTELLEERDPMVTLAQKAPLACRAAPVQMVFLGSVEHSDRLVIKVPRA